MSSGSKQRFPWSPQATNTPEEDEAGEVHAEEGDELRVVAWHSRGRDERRRHGWRTRLPDDPLHHEVDRLIQQLVGERDVGQGRNLCPRGDVEVGESTSTARTWPAASDVVRRSRRLATSVAYETMMNLRAMTWQGGARTGVRARRSEADPIDLVSDSHGRKGEERQEPLQRVVPLVDDERERKRLVLRGNDQTRHPLSFPAPFACAAACEKKMRTQLHVASRTHAAPDRSPLFFLTDSPSA